MTREVACVYFKASDGRRPSDMGRSIPLIESAIAPIPGAETATFMTDPKDSSQYLVAFPHAVDDQTAFLVAGKLRILTDSDDSPLIEEAWAGRVSTQSLQNGGGFTLRPR